jgi:4-hydroxybenzoyl-CoA reductase subunit beta
VLRLHPYEYHRPRTVNEAIALLAEHAGDAMPIAGGTDLVPNMKHRLFTPGHLVSLRGIEEMRGIGEDEAGFTIGAATSLDHVATDEAIRNALPSLARACSLVSGPQLRRMGTLGGNVCLDTRCTYYNQTLFWRKALGYCLKKDGTACHVVKGGTRCVAAHSADAATALLPLDAELRIAGPEGERTTPIGGFFTSDGVWNRRMSPGELLVSIHVPRQRAGTRHSFQKLRARDSIDFPMLNLAVRVDFEADGVVAGVQMAASAMGSYPRKLGKLDEGVAGAPLTESVVEALAREAFRQCHPLTNIPVDAEWRRAMVPVLVRRAMVEIRA